MKAYASSHWRGITTGGVQHPQLRRSAFAAAALLMTALAFVAPVRTLLPDAAGIVGQAIASARLNDATMSIAWSTYLVAYALLLVAAVAIWVVAIALMIWPQGAHTPGRRL